MKIPIRSLLTGVALACFGMTAQAGVLIDDFDWTGTLTITGFSVFKAPPPAPPFPTCGLDPTPDGLTCLTDCCGLPRDHFKTWRLQPEPFTLIVNVVDQFMSDDLQLSAIELWLDF